MRDAQMQATAGSCPENDLRILLAWPKFSLRSLQAGSGRDRGRVELATAQPLSWRRHQTERAQENVLTG